MSVNFSSQIEGRTAPKGKDAHLPGDRYSRLVLLHEFAGQSCRPSVRKWFVRCDCGVDKLVSIQGLRSGHTTSCGCYALEARVANGLASATHGRWCHPLYNTHKLMMHRCYNPERKQFANYGGRGLTVCERWHSVENFISDMAPSYKPGLSLEREDNSLGYSPQNCVWATKVEQGRNKRNNRLVSYQGRNICLAEACEIAGSTYMNVYMRITRYGWTISEAIGPDFGPPIECGVKIDTN